jgi:hypothetical protein
VPAGGPVVTAASSRALVDKYCVTCHNTRARTAGLVLEGFDLAQVGEHAEISEKVVRKVRAGLMPPTNMPRPSPAELAGFVTWMET